MLFANCPHCDLLVEIVEMNCKIFRCGVYRTDFVQIPQHLSKEECEKLIENRLIWGCGKPFTLVKINGEWCAVACDYI